MRVSKRQVDRAKRACCYQSCRLEALNKRILGLFLGITAPLMTSYLKKLTSLR